MGIKKIDSLYNFGKLREKQSFEIGIKTLKNP